MNDFYEYYGLEPPSEIDRLLSRVEDESMTEEAKLWLELLTYKPQSERNTFDTGKKETKAEMIASIMQNASSMGFKVPEKLSTDPNKQVQELFEAMGLPYSEPKPQKVSTKEYLQSVIILNKSDFDDQFQQWKPNNLDSTHEDILRQQYMDYLAKVKTLPFEEWTQQQQKAEATREQFLQQLGAADREKVFGEGPTIAEKMAMPIGEFIEQFNEEMQDVFDHSVRTEGYSDKAWWHRYYTYMGYAEVQFDMVRKSIEYDELQDKLGKEKAKMEAQQKQDILQKVKDKQPTPSQPDTTVAE